MWVTESCRHIHTDSPRKQPPGFAVREVRAGRSNFEIWYGGSFAARLCDTRMLTVIARPTTPLSAVTAVAMRLSIRQVVVQSKETRLYPPN